MKGDAFPDLTRGDHWISPSGPRGYFFFWGGMFFHFMFSCLSLGLGFCFIFSLVFLPVMILSSIQAFVPCRWWGDGAFPVHMNRKNFLSTTESKCPNFQKEYLNLIFSKLAFDPNWHLAVPQETLWFFLFFFLLLFCLVLLLFFLCSSINFWCSFSFSSSFSLSSFSISVCDSLFLSMPGPCCPAEVL